MNRAETAGKLDLIDDDFQTGLKHLDELIDHLDNFGKIEASDRPDIYWDLLEWRDKLTGAYLTGPEF